MAIENNMNPFASFDEERKNRYMQSTAPTLQAAEAEDAYKEAFPEPKTLQQSADNVVKAAQTAPPEKHYMYQDVREGEYKFPTYKTFNPDEYRDGTADGLARNYFSRTFKPKTEEDYSKENETKKKILALGDALRHIGNIVGTTNGAPAQQFNSPVAEAEQHYQAGRARRETTAYKKAQQDYQMAKLDGDRSMRELKKEMGIAELARKAANDQFNQDRITRNDLFNHDLATQKLNETKDYHKSSLDLQTERFGETKRHNSTMESISQNKASNRGSGGGSHGGKDYGTFLGRAYRTKADYDKAVLAYARRHGINTTYDKRRYNSSGKVAGYTETGRPVSSIAADCERHYEETTKTPAKPAKVTQKGTVTKPKTAVRTKVAGKGDKTKISNRERATGILGK